MEKEKCIRCGKPTPYDINTPITVRRYFIEGSGQLCEACFHILYPVPGAFGNSQITVPVEDKDIPNKL